MDREAGMELLNQRECGRERCLNRTLRFTKHTFDTGAQLRGDDLHGMAVDAGLPSPADDLATLKACRAMAVDFLERFPPPSRARKHPAARKGLSAGQVTALAWPVARAG